MRFLIDECVVQYVASALRDLGADVLVVAEEMPGIADEQVLQASVDEKRILISEDYGFGELVFQWGLPAVGVVLIAPGTIEKDLRGDALKVAHRIVDQAIAWWAISQFWKPSAQGAGHWSSGRVGAAQG